METMWPAGLTVLALAVLAAPWGLRWAWPRWRQRGQARQADADASLASRRPAAKDLQRQRDASLQRLQQRLVRDKLDLEAQLRAAKAGLDRAHHEHADAETSLHQQMTQQMEALHQTHEANLRHLLAVYLDQIDHLHRSHAHHSQALAAELERQKSLPRYEASEADSGFVNTVISDTAYATTSLNDNGFAPTTARVPKAWS